MKNHEAISVSKIAENVIDQRRGMVTPQTLRTMTNLYEKFVSHVGNKPLRLVTVPELNVFCLHPCLAPATQRTRVGLISLLYKHAVRMGYVYVNLTSWLRLPSIPTPEAPSFLTIPQSARLLKHAREFGLLRYVAVGLFAGLRPNELQRMDSSWISDGKITIRPGSGNPKFLRIIAVVDPLREWLALCPDAEQTTDPHSIRRQFQRLLVAASITTYPLNAMRHTCAIYALASTGDPTQVAMQMGHYHAMLIRYFRGLASEEQACKFFNLRPSLVLSRPDMPD